MNLAWLVSIDSITIVGTPLSTVFSKKSLNKTTHMGRLSKTI